MSDELLRRITRGEPLPRINSLVDICNWCSLEVQLAYGLYDADRIDGDVVLRRRVISWTSTKYKVLSPES